eukprot:TRINITY_DN16725_c0_g1_i1.p1 TRINITY_DN16725_c0_g1~~TRINITY_DN16725_c0_g1_i1.p1  ORF type:complete len:347 (+),score=99.64 TRINITY_DN16725_c0_g1_i1:219-1259(+)
MWDEFEPDYFDERLGGGRPGPGPGARRFEPTARVGEGTYGVVFRCRERASGRVVACKALKTHTAREMGERGPGGFEGGGARLAVREIAVLSLLNEGGAAAAHGVLPLEEVVANAEGCPILVTPLYDTDLCAAMRAAGALPRGALDVLTARLTAAVAYIHSHGVMHRDITPRNVLLTAAGGVCLGDFGVARLAAAEKEAQAPLSPPAGRTPPSYQAPECLLGAETYTSASDVWSLGATLAEAHLGRPLLQSTSQIPAILEMVQLIGWPPARAEWPGYAALRVLNTFELGSAAAALPALLPDAPTAVLAMLTRSPYLRPAAAALSGPAAPGPSPPLAAYVSKALGHPS